MERISLADGFEVSRIVHGHWRLPAWKMTAQDLVRLTGDVIGLGVTTFDTADIYGDYECERLFGEVLRLNPDIRGKIQIITKCGIKPRSDKFPERKIKTYDYSFNHITESVENSLVNLNTDHVDLMLLHRPAPFFDPEQVARAFSYLKKSGKVLYFGVSNFTPSQFQMLNSFTEENLVTNQVEISPYCLEHFNNGNIDLFLMEKIRPMAWSPLAGGRLLNPGDEKANRILRVLKEVSCELGGVPLDKIVYAWLLKHPASIIPVVGTGKTERINTAIDALTLDMSLEQWYKIYNSSTGTDLP